MDKGLAVPNHVLWSRYRVCKGPGPDRLARVQHRRALEPPRLWKNRWMSVKTAIW